MPLHQDAFTFKVNYLAWFEEGLLQILFKNQRLEAYCTNLKKATKKYGLPMAYKIQQRIQEIKDAESVELMIQYQIGHCHALTGDRRGQYSVRLVGGYRLIFTYKNNEINIVLIEEIVDYH